MITSFAALKKNLRTLLILGRVSNLPTVWSNCLAGCLLSQGVGSPATFLMLCFGATCLYVGGMFLNDAFDVEFDQQHRPERPIPSGAISLVAVWQWGLGFLLLGLICLFFLGKETAFMSLCLVLSILVYDAVHKMFAFSPILMAACRFFLVLAAASIGADGITGLTVWSGLVLASYIVGLSYLARKESTPSALRYWPCIFLAAPLLLAFIINRSEYFWLGLFFALLLSGWCIWCLAFTYWFPQRNIGRSVSGLLAGIALVDLLAVGPGSPWYSIYFLAFFGLSLLFQRFIPAT